LQPQRWRVLRHYSRRILALLGHNAADEINTLWPRAFNSLRMLQVVVLLQCYLYTAIDFSKFSKLL